MEKEQTANISTSFSTLLKDVKEIKETLNNQVNSVDQSNSTIFRSTTPKRKKQEN